MMQWCEYVRQALGNQPQSAAAQRTGVDQTTISRWLKGERRAITPVSVRKFALGFDLPVLEAFVYAGLLSDDDAHGQVRVVRRRSLDAYTTEELAHELSRRTLRLLEEVSA